VEVLVVDGGSIDGTREIVAAVGAPVRLVENPRVTAAAALNIGLGEAKGEVIVRADAHTLYEPDYVRRCVDVLEETGAANVGGAMRPVGTTRFGRAVAAVTSSPLGVGPGKFHYAHDRTEVDTVYLGCWRRETLEALRGWDEDHLQWGAEDHELNLRLRAAGGVIVLDPSVRSWYFPRETPRSLWRQYRNYGLGKASTLSKHRTLPTWRPLAPAALVAATALLGVRRPRAAGAVAAAHLGLAGALAQRLARDPGVGVRRTVAAVEICHWGYGVGFWQGIARIVSGRPFDSRPRGHR
jgi:cellulose synthase/poly-beta-1,6-N-acetylglucosamine synthase-like glycosyltransferase